MLQWKWRHVVEWLDNPCYEVSSIQSNVLTIFLLQTTPTMEYFSQDHIHVQYHAQPEHAQVQVPVQLQRTNRSAVRQPERIQTSHSMFFKELCLKFYFPKL